MRDVSLLGYDSPKEPERAIFAVPMTCFDCCELMFMTLPDLSVGMQLQSINLLYEDFVAPMGLEPTLASSLGWCLYQLG